MHKSFKFIASILQFCVFVCFYCVFVFLLSCCLIWCNKEW